MAFALRIHLEGVEEFNAALVAWANRAAQATEAGLEDAGRYVQQEIQAALERSEYPPASEPGTPPAIRGGGLRDSVEVVVHALINWIGQARIYPSTVYARIHELSGWAGRGHRSFLPKRPYVEPTLEESRDEVGRIMARAWAEANPRG